MKHILYLAAGSSRRFGGNKLLTPVNGMPLYRHGLLTLRDVCRSRCDCTLTVITRSQEIADDARTLGAKAVFSPESEKGIAYSIRAGIRSLGSLAEGDYLLFAVADQPYLSPDTVCRLTDAAAQGVLCATAAFGDQAGNPTLFSAVLAEELCSLEGDTGGRKILKRHADACAVIPCTNERELWDIDVRDDIAAIK